LPKHYLGRLAAVALLGGLLGVVTSLSNHGHGPAPAYSSQLLDAAWTWVAVGLLAGFAARRWVHSALASAVTFWAAILCYDLADLRYGVYSSLASSADLTSRTTDWLGLIGDLIGYSLVGVVASAGLASIILVIRRGGILGLLAQLVVPAYALQGSLTRVRDAFTVESATHELVTVNRAVSVISSATIALLLLLGLARLILRAVAKRSTTPRSVLSSAPSE